MSGSILGHAHAPPVCGRKSIYCQKGSSVTAMDPRFKRVNWPCSSLAIFFNGIWLGGPASVWAKTHGRQRHIPTNQKQIDKSDIYDDIPAYEVEDIHSVIDSNVETKVEPLTIQSFLSAKKKGINWYHLAEHADTPVSPYFYDEFGILLRRARLD